MVNATHNAEGVAGDVDGGPIVDLEEVAAVLDFYAFELAEHAVASIVDYDVNAAELGDCGVKGGANGGLGGQVYRLEEGVFCIRGWREGDGLWIA